MNSGMSPVFYCKEPNSPMHEPLQFAADGNAIFQLEATSLNVDCVWDIKYDKNVGYFIYCVWTL